MAICTGVDPLSLSCNLYVAICSALVFTLMCSFCLKFNQKRMINYYMSTAYFLQAENKVLIVFIEDDGALIVECGFQLVNFRIVIL